MAKKTEAEVPVEETAEAKPTQTAEEKRSARLEKMLELQMKAFADLTARLQELEAKQLPTPGAFGGIQIANVVEDEEVAPKTYYARADKYVMHFEFLAPHKALDGMGRVVEVPAVKGYEQEFDCIFGRKSGSYFTTTSKKKQEVLDAMVEAGDPYLSIVDSPAELTGDEKIQLEAMKAEDIAEIKKFLAKKK